jgi:DNA replication licensing factor MCM6
MSRFDLFFVILDQCDPVTDEAIARHIIRNHKESPTMEENARPAVSFTPYQLRKYIMFCRTLNPVMTAASRRVLVECYRLLRQNDILGKNKTAYRITVRQLESLIRLSEALARLHLSETIEPAYVREAYRLLQMSIIFVESEDVELDNGIEEEAEGMNMDHDQDSSRKRSSSAMEVDDEVQQQPLQPSSQNSSPSKPSGEEKAPDHDTESIYSTTSKRTRGALTAAPAPTTAPAMEEAPEPSNTIKEKKKSYISASEYNRISKILALRLKSLEEQASSMLDLNRDPGSPSIGYHGCLWKDLLQWYLTEVSNLSAFFD